MATTGTGLDSHGRLFKCWIAAHRELHNVAETHFGGGRFKQVCLSLSSRCLHGFTDYVQGCVQVKKLEKLPSLHARKYIGSIHLKHNPQAYADLMRRKVCMSSPGRGLLNASHIQPHLLLDDIEKLKDPVAEMQFLSLIARYFPPAPSPLGCISSCLFFSVVQCMSKPQ
jgi:hypothetical protein